MERNVSLYIDAQCAKEKTMAGVRTHIGVRRVRKPDTQQLTSH